MAVSPKTTTFTKTMPQMEKCKNQVGLQITDHPLIKTKSVSKRKLTRKKKIYQSRPKLKTSRMKKVKEESIGSFCATQRPQ